jgi:hypothetical protein
MPHLRWAALALSLSALSGCSDASGGNRFGGLAALSACFALDATATEAALLGFDADPAVPPSIAEQRLDCLVGVTTCAAAYDCFDIDISAPCTEDTADRCDGGTLVECARTAVGFFEQRTRCARERNGNNTCFVGPAGVGGCVAGTCDGDSVGCDGDDAVLCLAGIESRVRCGAQGRQCVESTVLGEPVAGCVDTVTACAEGPPRCEGDVVLSCLGGAGEVRLDCADIDPRFTCVDDRGATGCGRAAESPECDPGNVVCTGDVARFCIDGLWNDADCAAVEGATCMTTNDEGQEVVGCFLSE